MVSRTPRRPVKKKKKRKYKLKYRNIFIALAILILLLVLLITSISSCSRKSEEPSSAVSTLASAAKKAKSSIDSTASSGSESSAPSAEPTSSAEEEAPSAAPAVDILQNACFIGDSRMQGFITYNNLSQVADYTGVGLNIESMMDKPVTTDAAGNPATIPAALSSGLQFDRIYIKTGINELGWPYPEIFVEDYRKFLQMVKSSQPQATIIVEAVLPVSYERSSTDPVINNGKIAEMNARIQQLAKEEGVRYLDCGPALVDATGYLPPEATSDGIHLNSEYCAKWLAFLQANP